MKIRIIGRHVLYENPLPQLASRHSFFPCIQQLPDGSLLASHVLGEAFESVDQTTRLSRSTDMGKTWELLPPVYEKSGKKVPTSDYLKITALPDGRLLLFGYEYFREDPGLPIGNPETGGLLPDRIILLRSNDGGKTWSGPEAVPCTWNTQVEASAPITVLKNGDWVAPITGFPSWDGTPPERNCGRLLRSADEGRTWEDGTIIMEFPGNAVTTYEQRVCQLDGSGAVVGIAWNENTLTGERYPNHYAISSDGGRHFDGPHSTGIMGQAASVAAIGGDRLLALHCIRRDTDRPGIYGYIVNLAEGRWEIEHEAVLYEPPTAAVRDAHMAEIFSFLKFGQPSAIRLSDGSLMMTFWTIENGQGKTLCQRLAIEE